MSTKHTMRATIPCGPRDMGAEVDVEVTFLYSPGYAPVIYSDSPDPGSPAEVDFVGAQHLVGGKPSAYYGAYARDEQAWLNDLVTDWLDTDDGITAAMDAVEADMEAGREFRADLRAEMRREDDR